MFLCSHRSFKFAFKASWDNYCWYSCLQVSFSYDLFLCFYFWRDIFPYVKVRICAVWLRKLAFILEERISVSWGGGCNGLEYFNSFGWFILYFLGFSPLPFSLSILRNVTSEISGGCFYFYWKKCLLFTKRLCCTEVYQILKDELSRTRKGIDFPQAHWEGTG